jgi:chromosome transmission fidelity protein 18
MCLVHSTLRYDQINSQIIKPEEKAVLNRLVDLMVALDLRFVQDKAEDGSLVYRLDPYVPFLSLRKYLNSHHSPVDVFVTYDGKRSSDIAISRYATRQLVANEVGLCSQFLEVVGSYSPQRSTRECPRDR